LKQKRWLLAETQKLKSALNFNVYKITGQYGSRVIKSVSYSRYHNMAIMVTPLAGSEIDLGETILQISNGTGLLILTYNNTLAALPSSNGVFSTAAVFNLNASEFGIITVEEGDGSISATSPSINHGDKVLLTVNLSACFNGLAARTDIEGMVIPEHGSPGVFLFRTPIITTRTIAKFL
jgi:archaellin